jgi:mRNA-degrading endonuclease RelE of RelBE toxin-antitoxin system
LISRTTASFRRQLRALPAATRQQAKDAFRLFMVDPSRRSLNFKKLPPYKDVWSARVNDDYRVLGWRTGDTITWFFIGSHAEYDKLLRRLP